MDIVIYISKILYEFFIINFYLVLYLNKKFIIKYPTQSK
jgi:hypothetical protein